MKKILMAAALLFCCGMPAARAQWLYTDYGKVDKATTGAPTTNGAKVWDGTKWVFQVISGGTVPTSTGFPHITSGAQDPAARAVNLNSADVTGALPIGNGGNGQATAPAAIDALNAAAEASLAAASTTDLGAQPSQLVLITGNTTINSFGTIASGVKRWIRFSGTPQLTYNATSLILPTAANITAAVGDSAVAISLGSGNWRVYYQRGDGTALAGGGAAANGTGPVAGSFAVTETNLFKKGITINDAVDESAAYLISPSGSVLTVSLTNHPWVRTVMSADFSIALSDTSGITNGSVRLDIYTDGTHSVTAWPAGVVLPNTIAQPFPAGVRTATFERTQGTNYLYLSPNEISNADIAATAAIARSKLAAGSANQVLINDGSGLSSSEAQLAVSRGGTASATAPAAIDLLNAASEASVAAAATVDLGAQASQLVLITGSGGPITSFGTFGAGIKRWIRFSGTPTLTYNSTSMILPTSASIVVAAGDTAIAISQGSGNWIIYHYQRASGGILSPTPNIGTATGTQLTLSGSEFAANYNSTSAGAGQQRLTNSASTFVQTWNPHTTMTANVDFYGIPAPVTGFIYGTAAAPTETLSIKTSIDLSSADASGILAAARFPALTGDVTTSSGALATTIANSAVTLAKMANMATASIIGRATAGTGAPEVLTTLPWADTGDVTRSASSSATTIANSAVTNAKMANMVQGTIKARASAAGTGAPTDATALPWGFTGDVTSVADANALTLASVGTAGTYRSVTTDVKGRVTAGTNPTTFAGYAISDTSANLFAALTDETGSASGSPLAVFNQSPVIVTPQITTSFNFNGDTPVERESAAVVQLGTDSATATAQTLKTADGSGTDKVGAALTIQGGQGTGTGRGGDVIFRTTPSATTGSAANSYSERYHASAKHVVLTEATATTFVNITCASGKSIAGEISASVNADDGTNFQMQENHLKFAAVNKAGTITATIDTVAGTVATSSGTLTPVTFTIVANANSVDIKCAATSSLTQTTLNCTWAILSLNGNAAAVVTAQ